MERAVQRNDLRCLEIPEMLDAPGAGPRQLQRRLDCLAAAVAEEDTREADMRRETRRQRPLVRVVVEVGAMEENAFLGGRLAQRGDDPRVRVTERVDRDPAEHVEVHAATVVVQSAAIAADDAQRCLRVGRKQVARLEIDGAVHGDGGAHPARRAHGSSSVATTRVPPKAPSAPGKWGAIRISSTRASSAWRQARSFGIIPSRARPFSIKSWRPSTVRTGMAEPVSSRTPSTSVISRSRPARSPPATDASIRLALTLSQPCSRAHARPATTGS